MTATDVTVDVTIAGKVFANPIFVASGTFGYAREMATMIDLSRLGAIVPKTVTPTPRAGNAMPRTVETTAGMLNAIGLDNDGIDAFLRDKLPQLVTYGAPVVISLAVKSASECSEVANSLTVALQEHGKQVAAIELNISCPNVSGGVDFATDPHLCETLVATMKKALQQSVSPPPLWVKLSPNVTNIATIAKAAEVGGADAIVAINTCLGLSVDWRNRQSRLANGFGGLSGPAIKPIALRCVHQIARAVAIPVIGVGGIATIDDVMEFLVAGATAVQVGTANFFSPRVTMELVNALPHALSEAGVTSIRDIIGTLQTWG